MKIKKIFSFVSISLFVLPFFSPGKAQAAANSCSMNIISTSGGNITSQIKIHSASGDLVRTLKPFGDSSKQSLRVALGDVNEDDSMDYIIGSGPGGQGRVKVMSGKNNKSLSGTIGNFQPFGSSYTGGIFVASGDLNDDGNADVVAAKDKGGQPEVKVFSGANGSRLTTFNAYSDSFTGGVRVAVADVDLDDSPDIITVPGTGGTSVRVFDADGTLKTSLPISSSITNTDWNLAIANVDADDELEVIVGTGKGVAATVFIFDPSSGSKQGTFRPYSSSFTGGVRLGVVDTDCDGVDEIITAPAAGIAAEVKVYSGVTMKQLDSYFPFGESYEGGVFLPGTCPLGTSM